MNMDIDVEVEVFSRREKMLELKEKLLAVEEERFAGIGGVSISELDKILSSVIEL